MGTVGTSKFETVSSERGCVCYAPLVPRKGVGKRIQRKRTAGWKMPKNTVYVGRPSKWGNPHKLTGDDTVDDILTYYREWLETMLIELPHIFDLNELKDKKPCLLVCIG